jgi:hypothetical protein
MVGGAATVDQLHVTDPNGASNTGNDTTTIVPAHITVCKDVVPDGPTLWDFTLTGPSPGVANDLADGQCFQFGTNMLPGSYTLSETFAQGYFPSVDCGLNGFQNGASITFTLDPGEQTTCQFVNAFSPGPPAVGGFAGLLEEGHPRSSLEEASGPTRYRWELAGVFLLLATAAGYLSVIGIRWRRG